jgi:hypothetical protein
VIEVCVQPSHSLTTFVFKKGRDIGVPGPKLAGGQTVAIENATAVIRIANDIVFYCQARHRSVLLSVYPYLFLPSREAPQIDFKQIVPCGSEDVGNFKFNR